LRLFIAPLSAVPRPYEPVELVSYIRQARDSYPDQGNYPFSPPHVFATEYLGDQAHSRFDHIESNTFFKEATDFTIISEPGAFSRAVDEFLSNNAKTLAENETENSEPDAINDKAIGLFHCPVLTSGIHSAGRH